MSIQIGDCRVKHRTEKARINCSDCKRKRRKEEVNNFYKLQKKANEITVTTGPNAYNSKQLLETAKKISKQSEKDPTKTLLYSQAIINNPNSPHKAKQYLISIPSHKIHSMIALSPHSNQETLQELYDKNPEDYVKGQIAKNTNTNNKTLQLLFNNEGPSIKGACKRNPNWKGNTSYRDTLTSEDYQLLREDLDYLAESRNRKIADEAFKHYMVVQQKSEFTDNYDNALKEAVEFARKYR